MRGHVGRLVCVHLQHPSITIEIYFFFLFFFFSLLHYHNNTVKSYSYSSVQSYKPSNTTWYCFGGNNRKKKIGESWPNTKLPFHIPDLRLSNCFNHGSTKIEEMTQSNACSGHSSVNKNKNPST